MAWTKEEKAAYNRAYYAANREKIVERRKAYREANREKYAERRKAHNKAYYEANKEKKAAYYEANKEKKAAYRQANKEKQAAYARAYRQDNKERIASINARRRALKRKQIPVHLRDCPQEKERLVQIYKLCSLLSEVTELEHHVDHMWPLADGGPHWSGNLQVIPAEENLRKNASVCEATKSSIIKSLYSFESDRPI